VGLEPTHLLGGLQQIAAHTRPAGAGRPNDVAVVGAGAHMPCVGGFYCFRRCAQPFTFRWWCWARARVVSLCQEGLAPFCPLVKVTQCWVWVQMRLPSMRPLFVCWVYLPPVTSKLWRSSSAAAEVLNRELSVEEVEQAVSRLRIRGTGPQVRQGSGKCTDNHVIVLKHLVDRCQASERLYACFIGFIKAYDLVRWVLLMQCLADMGVKGSMLSCLVRRAVYWSTPMVVKSGRERGPVVDSCIGVRQGDPLSPLLFGLSIDRVESWLQEHALQCGVRLGESLLRVLLYADDLTLLAANFEDLQALLDALQQFCAANPLYVNVDKSVVVVFGRRKPKAGTNIPRDGCLLAGAQIPVMPEFRYLGIVFHQTAGVSACTAALSAAAIRAMWRMLSRCKSMQMPTLQLRVSLFESLVSPILFYCSEVWGPSVLGTCSNPDKCLDLALHRPLLVFLRRLGGNLRRSTRRGGAGRQGGGQCTRNLPYEPSLARVLGAHERAVSVALTQFSSSQ
jgi:hypothetical protein